jgi:hypothetical protein
MVERRIAAGDEGRLGPMVYVVRALHAGISVFFVACLAYVYYAALAGKRGPVLAGALVALAVEGVIVGANRGDCPLGAVHRRYGDEKTFFELFLPPRAAKQAVPVLGAVAVVGSLLVALRRPDRR